MCMSKTARLLNYQYMDAHRCASEAMVCNILINRMKMNRERTGMGYHVYQIIQAKTAIPAHPFYQP